MKSVTQKNNNNIKIRIYKNIKVRRECKIRFCDWLSNRILRNLFLRLTYPKLYFEDHIFVISSQNHKNKFRNNLFRNDL